MAQLARALRLDALADFDLKAAAQLIRDRGRGRDTILAHITPQEAALLKARGGRGSINPDTGLPEFEDDFGGGYTAMGDYAGYGREPVQQEPLPPISSTPTYDTGAGASFAAPQEFGDGAPQQMVFPEASGSNVYGEPAAAGGAGISPEFYRGEFGAQAAAPPVVTPAGLQPIGARDLGEGPLGPAAPAAPAAGGPAQAPAQPQSWWDRAISGLSDPSALARLGLGLGGGVLGMTQSAAARRQGQQAARQMADIGAPYRAQGQELISQAQQGVMSSASARAYEAARAQLAQQAARTGGVGASQAAAQLEQLRSSLLNNQYQLGLQVANIGDQYARAAIQQGLQANKDAATLSQNYYTALANVLAGGLGGSSTTARPATTTSATTAG